MGDRANLVISFKSTADAKTLAEALPNSIVLYSHWGGYDLGPDLARALDAARSRWDDDSYSARIIVSQVIGSAWNQPAGYGLMPGELGDNERAVLLVDLKQQKVRRFGDPGRYLSPDAAPHAEPTGEWTFEQFAAFTEDQARAAHLVPNE